ncbi:SAM-dependent methyltransferase [Thermoflexus sp.]|uniref:SAM-dependent methyltransferase n=1 Tax=Thermoflexus sp. TaxID=1969742 RepID=UPI002606E4ED|nr:SAM-dependent methyltransferase [Thermoflexus sp.]MCX7690619.1 SAM-dependent methyltransferase [Thermoflexus sp.]
MSSQIDFQTHLPNPGRVYDYVLGGSHNFEADRQAAEFMISSVPSTRKWVRMLRAFLQEAVRLLAEEGFDCFLDLGSGLPTMEHIHSVVPHARVIYIDIDPVVVAYGREILQDNPRVRYLQADMKQPQTYLNAPEIRDLFGDQRRVAIGFSGVSPFFTADEMRRVMHELYEWAAPGSKMFATFETKEPGKMTPRLAQFLAMFEQMGQPFYFYTFEECQELVRPWQPDWRGFQPLVRWLNLPDDYITEEDREGVGIEFYGVILEKR